MATSHFRQFPVWVEGRPSRHPAHSLQWTPSKISSISQNACPGQKNSTRFPFPFFSSLNAFQEISESLEKLRFEQPVIGEKDPAVASGVLFRIADLQEVSAYTKKFFDPADLKAVQIRLDASLIRRDLMAR